MTRTIHTDTEFHRAIASAVRNLNQRRLEDIRREVTDWLEPQDEKDAREEMIDAVAEALAELIDCAY